MACARARVAPSTEGGWRRSSGVALATGVYTYLSETCNVHISWVGDNIALPATLPPVAAASVSARSCSLAPRVSSPPHTPPQRVVRGSRFCYYQNVCTVSYSSAWWDAARWTREVDWMAMRGVNLPLAFTGQEWVWLELYAQFNLTYDDLAPFFTGSSPRFPLPSLLLLKTREFARSQARRFWRGTAWATSRAGRDRFLSTL